MGTEFFAGFGGVRLAAEVLGNPEDPRVLILPEPGQSATAWRGVAEALAAAGRQATLLDLRGHGGSAAPADGRYDLDAMAADLRAVLAGLEERPVVVAASLGGWVALAGLGEAAAQLASGLVLVDAPPGDFGNDVAEAWDPRFLDTLGTGLAERLLAAAAGVAVPTLIVRGERSLLAPTDFVRALAEAIAGAEAVEIEGAGHLVAADAADAFNAALLEFLERRLPLTPPEYRAGSDARTLRDALGCFATGVTVVTTRDAAGAPVGLTANSFTSVSLDPPLLLVCIARSVTSLPAFEAHSHFAVNVLHIGQQLVSNRFAFRLGDRFADTPWEEWGAGVPILQHALASFECARHAVLDGGDHAILLGRVERVRFEPRRDPLLYFRGKYRRLHFN